MNLSKIKAVFFDLDGTLYLGETLFDGVKDTLSFLRNKGYKIVYLTNNSSKSNAEYVNKLKRIGIYDERDAVYSSLDATIDYIENNLKELTFYPIATQCAIDCMKERGIKISEKADAVLLAYDTEFTYDKCVIANNLLIENARYFATHPDETCPNQPYFVPDTGSFINLFKTSSNRVPEMIFGKPYKTMSTYLLKRLNLTRDEILMVGDRLDTDILYGVNSEFTTCLVYTGITDEESYKKSKIKASFCLKDVNELRNLL